MTLTLCGITLFAGAQSEPSFQDIDSPPHLYRQRTPTDYFTRLKEDLESGKFDLDRSSEKAYVVSLLKLLKIPVSSQMWVFSTTSLQLSVISPSNPRALFFNDDLYLGFIPGGRIEIISMDPELGGIFYIFDIPTGNRPTKIERSGRCMNCHSGSETAFLPGLVVKSVVPGPTGGSLTAFRTDLSGHSIPYADRFGGWHVTGNHGITQHWGNLIGQLDAGKLSTSTNPPASRFQTDRYPATTSDVLAQVLHEHQVGFANRVIEASYRARTLLHHSQGKLTPAQSSELEAQARIVTRYLLFADEAPFPSGGIEGSTEFRSEFLAARRVAPSGRSLRDFNLKSRLFEHRCSYMIYSASFTGLPDPMKHRIYRHLGAALREEKSLPEYNYLSAQEKSALREILSSTLPDLPKGWPNAG